MAAAAASPTHAFTYTVTGLESDLSWIPIALPVAVPGIASYDTETTGLEPWGSIAQPAVQPAVRFHQGYRVEATCHGVARVGELDVCAETTEGFVLRTTGDLRAGDVVTIFIAPSAWGSRRMRWGDVAFSRTPGPALGHLSERSRGFLRWR